MDGANLSGLARAHDSAVVTEADRPPDQRRATRMAEALHAAHASLVTVPDHHTLDSALDWAAAELVARYGFDRVMIMNVDQPLLRIRRTVFRDLPALANEAHENAQRHPVELRPGSLEVEMLRRRAPALVDTQGDQRAWHPIVDQLDTPRYTASPVIAFGKAVATLHADTHFAGRQPDFIDRDALGIFAQVCGSVVERALLFEELSRLRGAVRANASQILALTATEGLLIESAHPPRGGLPIEASAEKLPLTSREIEIVTLMAKGATSSEIARRLVVSTGTVKTHARNILRKLGASTRAEAVAKFTSS
jgi:DNA-binding CsgD family transcriptional regulator